MIPLTLGELAAAVRGRLRAGADPVTQVVGDVAIDSRRVGPGGLFAALAGEHTDGHDYAAAALAAGAVAVLVGRPVGVRAVVVDDVVTALGLLARHQLARARELRVVGVTGSSGKTSTKDLVAALLEACGPTVSAEGSFNNEIGLPLTALRIDGDSRYLVLEYSARGLGHITYLADIARPQVAVVLNVGVAHLGEFGSRAAIAQAKGELVEALRPGGVAILNAGDPLVAAMATRTTSRVFTFGRAPDADLRAEHVRLDERGRPTFRVRGQRVSLRLVGEHHVDNALAALAVAEVVGIDLPDAVAVLADARPRSRWRMEVHERPDGVTIINDAYNANPDSLGAALATLRHVAQGASGTRPRRSWAVLGEMRELGAAAEDAHRAAGRLAVRLEVSRLISVGSGAHGIQRGAEEEQAMRAARDRSSRIAPQLDPPIAVGDVEEALALLRRDLRGGDVVLVKASRSCRFERLAEALLEDVVRA